ncbi:MAG: ABC transporter substrate-binding protein [Leptolyngbyaceae cyanobacterium SU_3_3]|nr:ABC transporter substrate-binding protein [Leptolyngbyaceae cyanobacterium SU_3_3]
MAVLSPYLLDLLLALGEQPIAYAGVAAGRDKFDRPTEQIPYLGRYVTTQPSNLGNRHNPSLEALVLSKPDLILGERWQGVQGQYELLSKIAPTVLVDDQQGGWQRSLQTVAKVLDRSITLQQVMTARQERVMQARQQLATLTKARPDALLLSSGDLASGFYLYGQERDVYSDLLEALGFRIVRLAKFSQENVNATLLSLEALPQIKADLLIVIGWDKRDATNRPLDWRRLQQEWNQIPVLKVLPVAQAGKVYFMDAYMTMVRGPLAEEHILKDLLQQLAIANE